MVTEMSVSAWLSGLQIDPTAWWRPIVCTNRHAHASHWLGIAHLDASGAVAYAPRPGSDGHWMIAFDHSASSGSKTTGSLGLRCPDGCRRRAPRTSWAKFLEAGRVSDAAELDVSLLFS